jgi:hypothetical protein
MLMVALTTSVAHSQIGIKMPKANTTTSKDYWARTAQKDTIAARHDMPVAKPDTLTQRKMPVAKPSGNIQYK